MVKMIATVRFTYAGVNLRAGDKFDARDKDVRLLEAIKKAKPAPVPVAPAIVRAKPVDVVLTEVTPDEVATPEFAPSLDEQIAAAILVPEPVKEAAKKRVYTYKRKDMRAETDE
jgi:hypothetical protein